MNEFKIHLKNEKQKQYVGIAYLFILINIFVFIYLTIASEKIRFVGYAILLLGCLVIDRFLNKVKKNEQRPYIYAGLLLAALGWLANDNWVGFAVCSLLDLLFLISYLPLTVKVNSSEISWPSFPKKRFSWTSVNNILLKDGLLTIDLRNNKLIQQFIDESVNQVEEKEFNEFCNETIKKNKVIH